MATPGSVKIKIQGLIDSANATTGKNDTYLTDAVTHLTEGYGQGGGSCSGNHIIEVDTLPTEGIDKTATYWDGKSYYRYVEAFRDILVVQYGQVSSFVEAYTEMGATIELYYAKTRPTENIVVSGETADSVLFAFYYVEYEDDILLYGDFEQDGTNEWMSMATLMATTFGGAITDISQATENDTMYALVDNGLKEYLAPSGSVTITENGTVDVTDKKSVVIDVPEPSGSVTITENGTYNVADKVEVVVNFPVPNGSTTITENGTYDITNKAEAIVSIPTMYTVQSYEDLPTDAPSGSWAIILGG